MAQEHSILNTKTEADNVSHYTLHAFYCIHMGLVIEINPNIIQLVFILNSVKTDKPCQK